MKTCKHCGAPIKDSQSECEYCGNDVEVKRGTANRRDFPYIPFGGKISAEISLPMNFVHDATPEELEEYCKIRLLTEMRDALIANMKIQRTMDPTTDFCGGPYKVRGTIVLGAIPKEGFFCRVNGKSYFIEGD
ncbi:MAG: hypothetical protein IJ306_01115 [Oscillospiraceae bacterium]|nr:hypothetical protein [Oscillospiraceae bacterium]